MEHGYLGHPTIVNNVETFCAAGHIALQGGAWWAGIGTPKSTGTKIHSVSGDCERPGLYEYPFGTRIGRILEDCGAQDTQAVQVGGPSGVCLSAFEFGRRIAFEDVPTAGAFMVFDRSRDMFEVARGFAHFFAHESCGFCTPCRVGTALVVKRLDKLAAGHGSRHDIDVLFELDKLMHGATHCGLGATACNPLRDTIAKFRPAYEQHLKSLYFEPGFDLDAELSIGAAHDRPRRPGRAPGGQRNVSGPSLPDGNAAFFTLDGEDVPFEPGDTVLQAATRAGRYIPHLCWHPEFAPHGSCRVCTVKAGGRTGAACTMPRRAGAGGRKRHRGVERAAQDAAADAVRRRQPLLPQLREERQLPAAGHRLRDGHGRARTSRSSIPTGRSMPATPTSCSTSTAASCASCACAPAATSTARTCSPSAAMASARGCWSTATAAGWATPTWR